MIDGISILYCVLLSGEFLERSYLGNLNAVQLNGYYAAAQFDGKVELHLVLACNKPVYQNCLGHRQGNSSLLRF